MPFRNISHLFIRLRMGITATFFIVLVFGLAIDQIKCAAVNNEKKTVLNVVIIGAGTSGLVSAKHAIGQGHKVTIYEQSEQTGGIWHYTDKVGKDKYGIKIHTAMYQGLRTNSPYQTMEYPDFRYPNSTVSYPPQADVLKFLRSYADHFDLNRYIKFSHLVLRVLPTADNKWEIIVRNLRNKTVEIRIFDAVFVCNGHYSTTVIPEIEGLKEFKGKVIHSHDFRSAEAFRDKSALVVGGGPSGIDIVDHLSKTVNRLTFSQHKRPNETAEERKQRQSLFSSKVTLQDNVKRFTPNGAEFIDGSEQAFDFVFFATGYNYSFPFLSVDAGISVHDNMVEPLYKQILNINHPTMAFIGIPFTTPTNPLFDLQVRFALKFITGAKKMPSKSEMLKDMQIQTQAHWDKGYRKHYTHFLGPEQREYFEELSKTAEVDGIPEVVPAMHLDSRNASRVEPFEYRKYHYTVIDNETFRKEKSEK